MCLARRMLALIPLLLLAATARGQRPGPRSGAPTAPLAVRRAALGPVLDPAARFVRSPLVPLVQSASPRRQRVFVVGGALAGAVVGGILITRGRGLAPCGSGGTPAFCTAARVVVVGGSAGVGALLGYLAGHVLP